MIKQIKLRLSETNESKLKTSETSKKLTAMETLLEMDHLGMSLEQLQLEAELHLEKLNR